jgi:hypothetical protein
MSPSTKALQRLLLLALLGAPLPASASSCHAERGRCTCTGEGGNDARCATVAAAYADPGATCRDHATDSACTANGRDPFCAWGNTDRPNLHGGGSTCIVHVCWLKMMELLVACPGLWPNVTTVGPKIVGSPSIATCVNSCGAPMRAFTQSRECPTWLTRSMLCDTPGIAPFDKSCSAKSAMRADFEAFQHRCHSRTGSLVELEVGVAVVFSAAFVIGQ